MRQSLLKNRPTTLGWAKSTLPEGTATQSESRGDAHWRLLPLPKEENPRGGTRQDSRPKGKRHGGRQPPLLKRTGKEHTGQRETQKGTAKQSCAAESAHWRTPTAQRERLVAHWPEAKREGGRAKLTRQGGHTGPPRRPPTHTCI